MMLLRRLLPDTDAVLSAIGSCVLWSDYDTLDIKNKKYGDVLISTVLHVISVHYLQF